MSRSDSPSGISHEPLPVSPALAETLPEGKSPVVLGVDRRLIWASVLAIGLGLLAAPVAKLLIELINLCTQLFFYGHLSTDEVSPARHQLGAWVILIPVLGGLIIGTMARWGASAIRGHGIPEAMEQVLVNQSRIPARITFLKPLSSAISIGTGGPFGAEGPIIATGGALGSFLGQLLHVTASERKTLLAAGAAAGMAAVFSAPVSAVLLAVELLLFEFRGRSIIPVALATVSAVGMRYLLLGTEPVFPMETVAVASGPAILCYALLGLSVGLLSVLVTRILYMIEDGFEKLPVHWMWWPAIGGLVVGVVGYLAPATFGVGYDQIRAILNGQLALSGLAFLCVMKFISWSVALGSGTSGGTLAPLFIIGGSFGACIALLLNQVFPGLGVDVGMAALVGMAAMFAGASRAFLTSVIFALEATRQPNALLPLLAACAAAYLLSSLLMRNTIMTEKISRRGVRVPDEYTADPLARVLVESVYTREPVTLKGSDTLETVRDLLFSGASYTRHQGFPVVSDEGLLLGVLTRRDLMSLDAPPSVAVESLITRKPMTVLPSHSIRYAADLMARTDLGRLVVVDARRPNQVLGVLTRSDVLRAHRGRLDEQSRKYRHFRLGG